MNEKELLKLMEKAKKMIAKNMEDTDKFKETIEKIKKLKKAIDK